MPGCKGGGGGLGKSELILYQDFGAFDSSSMYFIESVIINIILTKFNKKINSKLLLKS